jgi:hypothetical protein
MEVALKAGAGLEKTQNPQIIGCLVADKDGKTLLKFEAFKGSLDHYLQSEKQSDVELIPMFLSAMVRLSSQFNFQKLSSLDVKSANLIMTVFFFERYIITFLSKVGVKVSIIEVREFFTPFFKKHEIILDKYFQRGIIIEDDILNGEGNCWIKTLNEANNCSRTARDMSYL